MSGKEAPEIRKIKEGSYLLQVCGKYSYYWTQSLKDAQVLVVLTSDITSKQIKVKFSSTRLSFTLAGATLFDEKLLHTIVPDDCTWYIDRSFSHDSIPASPVCVCVIELVKSDRNSWWDAVMEGHDRIDTKEIEPRTSKISDIEDSETRSSVEKMMHDMMAKKSSTGPF